jgi:nitrous oxide reductase
VNKTIFEENWSHIRSVITAKWSLMVEYDLNKVDKAEVKFDKFVTMLQVRKPEIKLARSGQNTKPITKLTYNNTRSNTIGHNTSQDQSQASIQRGGQT